MATTVKVKHMAEAIDDIENWSHITVGRGKAPYHFWVPGNCGLYYLYRCMPDGYAGCRRAVEPEQEVTIHEPE